MAEVRVRAEGSLRWVRQSGVGSSWATASAPVSGLAGFVTNFQITSAFTDTIIYDRGTPDHHKSTQKQAPTFTFTCMWTGTIPTAVSGSGATVPMYGLEVRYSAAEMAGSPSAYYYQLYGATFQQVQFSEQDNGNTIAIQGTCLGYAGPTASGFLS